MPQPSEEPHKELLIADSPLNASPSGLGSKESQIGLRDVVLGTAWCTVSLVFGVLASIVGPTASILAGRTHATVEELAPVLGMGGLCTLIGGMPSGWLIDRVPGNPLLAVTLLLQAVGYALMPYCSSVLMLTITYAAVGLTFMVLNTGIQVMVIWQFQNPQHLSFVLNLVSAMFGLGGILAPQLVTLATRLGDGIFSYYMISVTCVVVAVSVAWLHNPRPAKKADSKGAGSSQTQPTRSTSPGLSTASGSQGSSVCQDASDDKAVIHMLDRLGNQKLPAAVSATTGDEVHNEIVGLSEIRPLLQRKFSSSSLADSVDGASDAGQSDWTIEMDGRLGGDPKGRSERGSKWGTAQWLVMTFALLVVFANVSIELGFAAWITTYCKNVIGMGDEESRGMTSTYWAAFTAGRAAGAVLSAFVSAPTLLLLSMPLSVMGPLMSLTWHDPNTTLVSVILVGLGAACGFPSTLSITAEVLDLDGSINGVISTFAGLAMTAMPALVPQLAKWDPRHGFSWLMILTLALGVSQLLGLVLLLVFKTRLQRSYQSEEDTSSVDDEELEVPLLS